MIEALIALLIIGVAGWLLATYVSTTLAALVVGIGVVIVLIWILRGLRSRDGTVL